MKYKCIIFDCDGVLVDSEGISIGILLEMANPLGAEIGQEYALRNYAGKSLKSVLADIESRLTEKLPQHFETRYRERTYEAFRSDLKPIEGIHKLLNQINIPYCVASSGPPEKIRLNLTTTGLIEKFENHIFSSYEINSWKPDPGIFEYAAGKMGFPPSECAVIEDSIAGIKAAVKGGFDVFGFVNPGNQAEMKNEGATTFLRMQELSDLLK